MTEQQIEQQTEGIADAILQRRAKLARLREQGIDPYPPRFHRTMTAAAAKGTVERQGDVEQTEPISLAGRLMALRRMGGRTFLDIRDGTDRVQLSFQRDHVGEEHYGLLKDLDLGDFLGATGHSLFRTKTGEVTLQVDRLTVLAKALLPPPEKWHGLKDVEQRYRQRYLDLISNEQVRNTFRIRSKAISQLRRFMEDRGFIEAETPVLQAVAAGAMATPFVTQHKALDRTLYLRIATELHLKRLIVGGFDKVFEVGRLFRNEGIDTRHNPEFTTMESYAAYEDYNDVMRMVEDLVAHLAQSALGTTKIAYQGKELDLTPPWRRVSLIEETERLCGINLLDPRVQSADGLRSRMREIGLTPKDGTSWPQLADKLIGDVVEPTLVQPTFLLDYPVAMSPLAKGKPGNPMLVERFEGFIAGMEVANAFTELNDPLEQRARLQAQEESRKQFADEDFDRLDEDFVTAIEHGMPPTGGLGLGIDRLVMLLTDNASIREVILFPQLRN